MDYRHINIHGVDKRNNAFSSGFKKGRTNPVETGEDAHPEVLALIQSMSDFLEAYQEQYPNELSLEVVERFETLCVKICETIEKEAEVYSLSSAVQLSLIAVSDAIGSMMDYLQGIFHKQYPDNPYNGGGASNPYKQK